MTREISDTLSASISRIKMNDIQQTDIKKKKTTAKTVQQKVEDPNENTIDLTTYDIHLDRNFPCMEKPFSENLDILELHDFLLKKFQYEKETKTKLLTRQIHIENQKFNEPLYLI